LQSHEADRSRTPRASRAAVWSARCCISQRFLTIDGSVAHHGAHSFLRLCSS
jgi:hypothetical protein